MVCITCGMAGESGPSCQFCGGKLDQQTSSNLDEIAGLNSNNKNDNFVSNSKNILDKKTIKKMTIPPENLIENILLPFGIANAPQYSISTSIPFGVDYVPN